MARKKDKTHGLASARAGILTKDKHSTAITKPNNAKSKLPAIDSTLKHHPSRPPKATNAHQPVSLHDGLPSKSGHKNKAMPQTSTKDGRVHSTDRLAINKRPRDDELEKDPGIPDKRPKLNDNAGLGHRPDINAMDNPIDNIDSSAVNSNATAEIPLRSLPAKVQHLRDKYDFSTMSILSSSKIESRVRNLLERTGRFSFAESGTKPGVVILTAKAKAAAKMCSIVEIAKEQIKKEKGNYWQYSTAHSELVELRPKEIERTGERTLAEWDEKQAGESIPKTKIRSEKESAFGKEQDLGPGIEEEEDDDDDEDTDGAFETMIQPKERNSEMMMGDSGDGEKVRNTPVMTIFFARVPVPGLKDIYG